MKSSIQRKAPERTRLELVDRLALFLLFIFLLENVLDGAVRYYAVEHHVRWLPYVPHLLLALALLPMFLHYLIVEGLTSTYLIVLLVFGVATSWGVLNVGGADQVEFGLWVFVGFFYGIVALPALVRGWQSFAPYVFVLWGLAVVGVLVNSVHSWPWVGLQYQVGATSVEASRLWTAGALGFSRLPGFSRASFDVALQVLIFCIYLAATLQRKWWIVVWVLSAVAIALTTDKTIAVIFLLFTAGGAFRRQSMRPIWRYVPLVVVSLATLLPFSMLLIKINWLEAIRSHLWVGLIASFVARLQTGWPEWLRMIFEHGNWFLGRGVGGIGTAQMYFEPSLYSPGDNIAVYFYGSFGIPGLFLLFLYARKSARCLANRGIARFLFLCSCVVLFQGVTSNVLEGTLLALAFGASLRFFQSQPVVARRYEFERAKRSRRPLAAGDSSPACP